jgi:glycyl-tRNA synthetase beta subunit
VQALLGHWKTLTERDDWLMAFYPLANFKGIRKELRPFDAWEPDCELRFFQDVSEIDTNNLYSIAFSNEGGDTAPSSVDYDKFSACIEVELRGPHRFVDIALHFLADRLKVQQREAGVRHDLIDAVFALGGEDDLVRLLARVKALQAFMETSDGTDLLAGYKRAANLLKQAGEISPASSAEGLSEHDLALLAALDAAEPAAAAAVGDERFTDAMTALAGLREPIDAFFTGVMVNDPDPQLRDFRLGLLLRFRDAVHAVADFSKIEG